MVERPARASSLSQSSGSRFTINVHNSPRQTRKDQQRTTATGRCGHQSLVGGNKWTMWASIPNERECAKSREAQGEDESQIHKVRQPHRGRCDHQSVNLARRERCDPQFPKAANGVNDNAQSTGNDVIANSPRFKWQKKMQMTKCKCPVKDDADDKMEMRSQK